jgi:hypothetical protein
LVVARDDGVSGPDGDGIVEADPHLSRHGGDDRAVLRGGRDDLGMRECRRSETAGRDGNGEQDEQATHRARTYRRKDPLQSSALLWHIGMAGRPGG